MKDKFQDDGGTPAYRARQRELRIEQRNPLRFIAGRRRWARWTPAERTLFAMLLPFGFMAAYIIALVSGVLLFDALGLLP